MISVTTLTPSQQADYDAYITKQTEANVYHNRAWIELLKQTYGYTPATLIAQDDQKNIRGALPLMKLHGRIKGRRLVSLPFSHAVPLLADDPEIARAILDAAVEMAKSGGYRYMELRTPQSPNHDAFKPATLNYISDLQLTLPLDEVFNTFGQSNRRRLSKTEKSGLFPIREGTTEADFQSFYELEVATRHRQGAPVYPTSFFPNMLKSIGGETHLYLLDWEGQTVAGMLVLHSGETCIYGYGAALRIHDMKKYYPMNWLIWHAIQQAHKAGLKVFDFGTTPIHNEGLLEFKQHFNPDTREIAYWYALNGDSEVPVIKRDSTSVKLVSQLLHWMPRPLFLRVSPLLLREVG